MSQQLISHSLDLTKLRNEGYEVEVASGYLIIHNVPYVNAEKKVKRGALVSELTMAGDITARPSTHVALFAGECPCDKEGRALHKIRNGDANQKIYEGLVVTHSFSSKPKEGYQDYYEKMTTYISLISSHAEAIAPEETAKTFKVIESDDPESPFNYIDTASSRAEITTVTKKLELGKVGIIGLGGTGSYVLDFVAKTPVKEIHVFDGDAFLQHNAFRSPGAAPIEQLKNLPKKVEYFKKLYSHIHKNIIAHDFNIEGSNVKFLSNMDFVFVCIDGASAKRPIIEELENLEIPFVDVGMGVELVENQLLGVLRVTTSTKVMRSHVREKNRIPLVEVQGGDDYSRNIQIADLNALNAALAVVKWKKHFGFYADFENEHFTVYTIDGNHLLNEDKT